MFQGFGQAFVITLREGLEAFLIVAISLAYLRKRGRWELTKAVHWGIVTALAVSAFAVPGVSPTSSARYPNPFAAREMTAMSSWMVVDDVEVPFHHSPRVAL